MKKIVFLLLFVCMGVSSALSQELILNGKWKYITGIDNAEFSKKDFNDSGKVFGEEVVQLYVGDDVSSVSRPQKELKGFKKIGLNPGKKQKISFTLNPNDFSFYNKDMQWVLESGTFTIMIGASSQDIKFSKKLAVH